MNANQPQMQQVLSQKEVLEQLSRPFEDHEIEWKIENVIQNYYGKTQYQGIGFGYIDARAIQRRLNEVCGLNWSSSYQAHLLDQVILFECTIGIYVNNEWIYRTDGVELEIGGIERGKSAYSNALKRAAVHFGIGHFLYELDTVYIDIYQNDKPNEKQNCPSNADKYVSGNFKVNGNKVFIKGKYVTPKYSEIIKKQNDKKSKQGNTSQQQQNPSSNPQRLPQTQNRVTTSNNQQRNHSNSSGPTPGEYRHMVNCIFECFARLGITPENAHHLYSYVDSPVYERIDEAPFEVLQALFAMLNPIKLLLELGESTFKLDQATMFNYASHLLNEPIQKISHLFNKLDKKGLNIIFDRIRKDQSEQQQNYA